MTATGPFPRTCLMLLAGRLRSLTVSTGARWPGGVGGLYMRHRRAPAAAITATVLTTSSADLMWRSIDTSGVDAPLSTRRGTGHGVLERAPEGKTQTAVLTEDVGGYSIQLRTSRTCARSVRNRFAACALSS